MHESTQQTVFAKHFCAFYSADLIHDLQAACGSLKACTASCTCPTACEGGLCKVSAVQWAAGDQQCACPDCRDCICSKCPGWFALHTPAPANALRSPWCLPPAALLQAGQLLQQQLHLQPHGGNLCWCPWVSSMQGEYSMEGRQKYCRVSRTYSCLTWLSVSALPENMGMTDARSTDRCSPNVRTTAPATLQPAPAPPAAVWQGNAG